MARAQGMANVQVNARLVARVSRPRDRGIIGDLVLINTYMSEVFLSRAD
jgi:hypothetical protein